MRKTKEQKGITLVALIITIIVLLILAVVAIGVVQNDGIINYAKNAKSQYGVSQKNENVTLQGYFNKIQEHAGTGVGTGMGTGETITFVVDRETYTAEQGMTWEQWLNSSYYSNASGLKECVRDNYFHNEYSSLSLLSSSSNGFVKLNHEIIAGNEYYWG